MISNDQRLRNIFVEHFGVMEVTHNNRISELLDSLEIVQLELAIQDEFDKDLDLRDAHTFGDVLKAVTA